jgi:alkylhydroperoxidase family enzyme
MARVRFLEGRNAGIAGRLVQAILRAVLGRELNPYKVLAHARRPLLAAFLSNTLTTRGHWAIGAGLQTLVRLRVAARNGCPF